jgi:hypothetical protein
MFSINELISIINNGLDDLYKNLNSNDLDLIKIYTTKLIEIIAYQYNLSSEELYMQLSQNDYKDVKWLSSLILPYINVPRDNLKSFKEMYTEKLGGIDVDINKEEPKYIFTNIQYSRCNNKNNIYGEIESSEIEYNASHLEQNFMLLVKSVIKASHKLYVNWINIIPIPLTDIEYSNIYKNTTKLIIEQKYYDIMDDLEDIVKKDITDLQKNHLESLYIGDIYNCCRNYLYDEIKTIKLLIFDLYVSSANSLVSGIYVLHDLFTENNNDILKKALNDFRWLNLEETERQIFKRKWETVIDTFLRNDNIVIQTNNPEITQYTIASVSLSNLIKAILIGFEYRYKDKKDIKKDGYKNIKTNKKLNDSEDLNEIDEENITEFKILNSKEVLNSINLEYIYDFLRDILQQFKMTIYSHTHLSLTKDEILETVFSTIDNDDFTQKNLYNYAKSLSHVTKNKIYILLDKNWDSLSQENKKIILDRINNKVNPLSWFDISRILKTQQQLGLFDSIKDIPIKNINIYNSIWSRISFFLCEILIKKGLLSRIRSFKLTPEILENNKVFDLLKKDILSNVDENIYLNNSYYYLTEKLYGFSENYTNKIITDDWYSMDPMQWVSQIGFVHHFINNRVSFVSGATGVGKSTHVPKLFMYNLKAIDYKSFGSVVCTQPRRTPTENGAKTVSSQLGLPIYDKKDMENENDDDIATYTFTDNYNVQMQHQERKHIKTIYGLILKFITDGSLVQEFKDILPHFKRTNFDKSSVTNQNIYDIIIIDESHEHNKNMDILLTLMRSYVYYNPSIRLVILSATLEEDEPIYRRYYRSINDNYKYPFSITLQDKKLDRINVDRRYDISSPSAGTRFNVLEYYKPNYDIVVLIKELINAGKGDILVFQPGENDINMLIEQLNSSINDNWIALPFYSTLSDDKRKFIENIDNEFDKLRIDDRQQRFNDIPSLTSGKTSYTNFVLVATNIAEASITISRLYYVVDTGTRKINTYDYKRRSEKLILADISETSRVQRKGRVGRRREGEAYFIYEKGKTSKNKIPYDFSISNVSNDIYVRLKNSIDESEFIVDKYKLYDIIKLNYETTDGEYKYRGNPEYNDYTFKYFIPKYYESGYSKNDLYDDEGKFYLIHPEELNIERNINGKIINVKTKDIKITNIKKGKIKSEKVDSFFLDFKINNYIDDNENKTEEGINMTELVEKFKLKSTKNTKCIIYSILTNSYEKMLLAISILESCNNDIMRFAKRDELGNIIVNIIKYHGKYDRYDSDINIMIAHLLELFKSIEYTDLFKLENYINESLIIQNKRIYSYDILKKLKSHDDNEDFDRELIIQELLYKLKNELFNNYDKYYELCNKFEINVDILLNKKTMNTIIDNYIKINDIKENLYYEDKRGKKYDKFLNTYSDIYRNKYSNYDPFKLSFILSNPYNLALNIDGTNSYLLIYYPYATNIYHLDKTKTIVNKKKQYIPTTYMNIDNAKEYIYFDVINADKDTLYNIIKIDKTYLEIFKDIYNKDRLKQIVEKYEDKIDRFISKLETDVKYKAPLSKDYNIIIKFQVTFKKLLTYCV